MSNTQNATPTTPIKTATDIRKEELKRAMEIDKARLIENQAIEDAEELDKKALAFIRSDVESIQDAIEEAVLNGVLSLDSDTAIDLMKTIEKALFTNKKKVLAKVNNKKKTHIRAFNF